MATQAEILQRYAYEFWKIGKVPHDPQTTAFLEKCEPHTIEVNEKTHKYHSRGDGPTVLLVHGVHSNLGAMVPIAESLLEQGYRVVLFDAPSHGESPGKTTDPVEVSGLIRALFGRLGDLHAVVGHSLGGLWTFAAWNDAVDAKAFVSISSPATMMFLVDKFVELAKLDEALVPGLITELEGRVGGDVWTAFSPSENAGKVDVPGLIIHGTGDDFVPPEHGEQLHSAWSGSTLELIKDARHFDLLRSPDVRKAITAFLQEVR